MNWKIPVQNMTERQLPIHRSVLNSEYVQHTTTTTSVSTTTTKREKFENNQVDQIPHKVRDNITT